MKDFHHINAFLFDFGNVIINIDFELMYNKFREYLGKEYDSTVYGLKQQQFFQEVERKPYTVEQMTQMINQFGAKMTTDQVKESWNALLLDIPVARLKLLKQLSKNYPIYLLSNTNLVHIEEIFSNLESEYGANPICDNFEKLYLSYEIGYIKPEREIYEYVLQDAGLNPQQCLFFDDLQENLDGAAELGIQTQLVTKDYGILEFFEEHHF